MKVVENDADLTFENNTFPLEQTVFPIQATGKTSNFSIGGQNTMARDQNWNWICPARAADGADGLGFANCSGKLTVTLGPPWRDLEHCGPNALLKLCFASPIQWRQFSRPGSSKNLLQGVAGIAMPLENRRRNLC